MISLRHARRSDRLMKAATSLTVAEFDALARQFVPVWAGTLAAQTAAGAPRQRLIGICFLHAPRFSGVLSQIRVSTNGNVGIRTATPTVALSVVGDASVSGTFLSSNYFIGSGSNLWVTVSNGFVNTYRCTNGAPVALVSSVNVTNGNVGIQKSPTVALDLTGAITASGNGAFANVSATATLASYPSAVINSSGITGGAGLGLASSASVWWTSSDYTGSADARVYRYAAGIVGATNFAANSFIYPSNSYASVTGLLATVTNGAAMTYNSNGYAIYTRASRPGATNWADTLTAAAP